METAIVTTAVNQMAFLFSLILIGWLLVKCNILSDQAAATLSKLENWVFQPALVFGTFVKNCSVERIQTMGLLMLGSAATLVVAIPLSILLARLISKDPFIRNMITYGLSFANFGFMGCAVVEKMFPDIFMEYLTFILVLYVGIYLWGAPVLLMGDPNEKQPMKKRLKAFLNPMLIAMLLGIAVGLTGIKLPAFAESLMTQTGNCMSPVAMLLTGMVVASVPLKKVLAIKSLYLVSALRLLVYPVLAMLAVIWLPVSDVFKICTVAALSMPLGLNTIVIPAAYGKDTTYAAGMALVSHTLSLLTIPFVFWLYLLLAG